MYWSTCCLASSIHSFIYFLPFLMLSSSISYQFKSPCSRFPASSHLYSTSPPSYSPVKMINSVECMCVSVGAILYLCKQRCLSGHWSEASQYYRLLLRDREMTNSESEWVRVCFNAFFMSVYRHAWFSGCRACLRFCSLCLSLRPIYCLRATTVVKSSRKTFEV